jgi:hypothetical protein
MEEEEVMLENNFSGGGGSSAGNVTKQCEWNNWWSGTIETRDFFASGPMDTILKYCRLVETLDMVEQVVEPMHLKKPKWRKWWTAK